MVTVAMSAMMRNNPTKKTMLKVTMSMMTTLTTISHRDFQNDWSSFPSSTVQCVCIQGVLWSSRCCCLLDWVARPCGGLCSNALPREWPRNSSFPTLFCLSPYRSACVLVRACAVDVARQRGSAPRSCRNGAFARNPGNLLLFCEFLRFLRCSIASASLGIFQC